MKIYIVIWKDRHCDTDAFPFSTAEKAIEFAREKAHEYDRFGEYEEQTIPGWIFFVTYSCEGDGLRVIEKELDTQ